MSSLQTRTLTYETTAVVHAVVTTEQLEDCIPRACAEVAAYLHRHGIPPYGYPFARCHWLLGGVVAVEAGVPVAVPIAGQGRIESSTLPGGPAVVVHYDGAYAKIGLAQHTIDDWLLATGGRRAGDGWEIYPDLPSCDRLGRRVDVVQPITFAHSLV